MMLPQWLELTLAICAGLTIGALLLTLWLRLETLIRPGTRSALDEGAS
jgi:hypothetical protein